MISCDTNILFPLLNVDATEHLAARAFFEEHATSFHFILAEQALLELYCLLRNPTPNAPRKPLTAKEAVDRISILRSNSRWRVVDMPSDTSIMENVWAMAAKDPFAYRRIYDMRLAFTLRHHGVTRFATRNKKDFVGCGFVEVFDPLK